LIGQFQIWPTYPFTLSTQYFLDVRSDGPWRAQNGGKGRYICSVEEMNPGHLTCDLNIVFHNVTPHCLEAGINTAQKPAASTVWVHWSIPVPAHWIIHGYLMTIYQIDELCCTHYWTADLLWMISEMYSIPYKTQNLKHTTTNTKIM
jgi:hypothetical protein